MRLFSEEYVTTQDINNFKIYGIAIRISTATKGVRSMTPRRSFNLYRGDRRGCVMYLRINSAGLSERMGNQEIKLQATME